MSTELKLIGIVRRLDTAPKSMRQSVLAELEQAVNELRGESGANSKLPGVATPEHDGAVPILRNALTWPEVRANPAATASISRKLRALREQCG